MRSHLYLSAVMTCFLMLTASVGRAEVNVQGTPEGVQVEAKNASIEEVLRALHDAYGLNYQSEIPLEIQVSGIYAGPLPSVLTRLLEGNNFVLTRSENTVQVVITSAASRPIPGTVSVAPFPFLKSQTKAGPTPTDPLVGIVFPPPGPPAPSKRE
jgi:hypothetical protein